MNNVVSLDDYRTKKAKEVSGEAKPCPKCKANMLPGIDSNQEVWVCTVCTLLVWTQ